MITATTIFGLLNGAKPTNHEWSGSPLTPDWAVPVLPATTGPPDAATGLNTPEAVPWGPWVTSFSPARTTDRTAGLMPSERGGVTSESWRTTWPLWLVTSIPSVGVTMLPPLAMAP